MAADVLVLINKAVDAIKDNDGLKKKFSADPIKTLEKLLGVDLPDELMDKVVDGVKSKIAVDDVMDAVSKLKKLF